MNCNLIVLVTGNTNDLPGDGSLIEVSYPMKFS